MNEIWIPCEGSGAESRGRPTCPMCGHIVPVAPLVGEPFVDHLRDDIIARIARGDFDA